MDNLLRIKKVMQRTGLAQSTIWWMVSKNEFPKQIKISPRISVWKESDINNWIESKISNKS